MAYTLITGATGGIGKAFAQVCAQEHRDVILTARNQKELDAVKQDIESHLPVHVMVIPCDLSDPQAPQQLYTTIKNAGLHVDLLINNAGFSDWTRYVDANWNRMDAMMQVNMRAVAALCYLFGRDMVTAKSGHIINIASIAAAMPGPYMAMYYATKAFVRSLGEALAYELRGTGVTVTTICPGPVSTGFAKAAKMGGRNFANTGHPATPQQVAQFAYRKAMRGRTLAYQGALTKVIAVGVRVMPVIALAALAARANGGDPNAHATAQQQ